MWGVSRWIAGFLVLVMLVPALGPSAMACAGQSEAVHCMRQSMAAHATGASMPCHRAMGSAPSAESSTALFPSADAYCQNHNCCCCTSAPEWAKPAPGLLSSLGFLIEAVQPSPGSVLRSSDAFRDDSARAPPRS